MTFQPRWTPRVIGRPHATPRPRDSFRLGGEWLEDRRLLSFDPSPIEQAFMESINRIRTSPQSELEVIFSSTESRLVAREASIQAAIEHFQVSRSLLLQQWSELTPVAPLAWNEDLTDAALGHNLEMLRLDEQSHQLPGEPDLGTRIRNEGYALRRATENVYAFAESHLHGHAGFAVDWGVGPGGIQDPAGHRLNYMDPDVREVGISVVVDNNPSTEVGPYLVTQNFGRRDGYAPQMLGVVYDDLNHNGIYDPQEGKRDVTITFQGVPGTFTTTTMTAGGYQMAIPAGTYNVTASAAGIVTRSVSNVSLGTQNRKVDFVVDLPPQPPVALNDTAVTSSAASTAINVLTNDSTPTGQLLAATVTIVSDAEHGTLTVGEAGQVFYQSESNYVGTDSFTYTVKNSEGATSNEATVLISVQASTNRPPMANPDRFAVVGTNARSLSVLLNDTDPDGNLANASLEIVAAPTRGVANIVGGEIRYTPNSETIGMDMLSYRVADRNGGVSEPTLVTIYQVAANRAWQNPVSRLDVNGDGVISPLDALLVINHMGQPIGYPTTIAGLEQGPLPFIDVDGDNTIAPLDALLVINALTPSASPPLSAVAAPVKEAIMLDIAIPRLRDSAASSFAGSNATRAALWDAVFANLD